MASSVARTPSVPVHNELQKLQISSSRKKLPQIDEREFSKAMLYFLHVVLKISNRVDENYGSVYLFGSVARMLAAGDISIPMGTDLDIYIEKNINALLKDVNNFIDNLTMMDFNQTAIKSFKRKSVVISDYGDFITHYKYELMCEINHNKFSIDIDFVSGSIHRPLCSFEVFKYDLNGPSLRVSSSQTSYFEELMRVKEENVLIYKSSFNTIPFFKKVERIDKLLAKYPSISFKRDWEDDDDKDDKSVFPINRVSYERETGNDAICCICQTPSSEVSDDTRHKDFILETHCGHLMCFECANSFCNTIHENGRRERYHRCPMCRQHLH
jgi:hypothetical protein